MAFIDTAKFEALDFATTSVASRCEPSLTQISRRSSGNPGMNFIGMGFGMARLPPSRIKPATFIAHPVRQKPRHPEIQRLPGTPEEQKEKVALMPAKFIGFDYTLLIPDGWTRHPVRDAVIFCKFETPVGALYVMKYSNDELVDADPLEFIQALTDRPDKECVYHKAFGETPEMFSVEFSRDGWHEHCWVATKGPNAVSMSYRYQSVPDREELREVHEIVESLRFTV